MISEHRLFGMKRCRQKLEIQIGQINVSVRRSCGSFPNTASIGRCHLHSTSERSFLCIYILDGWHLAIWRTPARLTCLGRSCGCDMMTGIPNACGQGPASLSVPVVMDGQITLVKGHRIIDSIQKVPHYRETRPQEEDVLQTIF